MKRKNKFITTLLFFYFTFFTIKNINANDSIPQLDVITYINLVKKFHPIVKQTNNDIEQAKANVLVSQSGFDPIFKNQSDKKTFDGTNYFNTTNSEIIVPTWYGVNVVAGLENINGLRVSNENTIGKTSYFGLNVPLAKGLLMDKRRGTLLQAKIFNKASLVEQKSVVNNLIFESLVTYWDWVNKANILETYNRILKVNQERFAIIKKIALLGERAAIDTIEALTQLQTFEYAKNNAALEFGNATVALNTYLWNNNEELVNLPENIQPIVDLTDFSKIQNLQLSFESLIDFAVLNHPDLQMYQFKLSVLEIDRKIKQQELLPKIDFKYNQLGKGYNFLKTSTTGPLFENNFKYGLKVEIPLRLSQGRGEYKIAKLKIENTKLDQLQKEITIKAKIKTYFNDFINNKNQIVLLKNTYTNYQKLVNAEEIRFKNGESSLFLINSRENKALEAYIKLIETTAKCYKSYYATLWATGNIN
jgi:outer membrane protein TolC